VGVSASYLLEIVWFVAIKRDIVVGVILRTVFWGVMLIEVTCVGPGADLVQ
jgi:hypothetical protein